MNDKHRRGLGRGLGSLIPAGPVATVDGTEVEARAHDGHQRSPQPSQAPQQPQQGPQQPAPQGAVPPADWIGRIPPPGESTEGPSSPAGADAPDAAATSNGSAPSELTVVEGAHYAEIPVGSITPNPRQPRQVFDEDAMAELVASINEVGLLQPVVVRPREGGYELIMGERRWRATQRAGLEVIPAIVRETAEDALLRDALLENLHRSQLNPLEEAAAYQQLLDDFGCTQEELSGRIGRSRPQISNTLRLLKLSAPVQRRVAAGILSAGHARALLSVVDPATQDRLAERVVAEGISVRALEEIVAVGEYAEDAAPRARRAKPVAPHAVELADRLSDLYETRVRVDLGQRKGRITIEFASLSDLERIVSAMDPSLGDKTT